MKKWWLLIILGFILTSFFAITYTNQVISTFNFDEDNENGGEDNGIRAAAFKVDYLNIKSQKSELNMIWNKIVGDFCVDVALLHTRRISHSKIHLNSLGVIQNNSLNRTY